MDTWEANLTMKVPDYVAVEDLVAMMGPWLLDYGVQVTKTGVEMVGQ